jgi:hypothetical protein
MKWNEEQIEHAWQHARVASDADPSIWRQDACGAWIRRDQLGRAEAEFGWKIENVSGGGPHTAQNLRPFHVHNHFDVGKGAPHCRTTADRGSVPAGEYAGPPRNRIV